MPPSPNQEEFMKEISEDLKTSDTLDWNPGSKTH